MNLRPRGPSPPRLLSLALLGALASPVSASSPGRAVSVDATERVHRLVRGQDDPRRRADEQDAAVVHLLGRATFGATPELVGQVRSMGVEAWLDEQLHPERIPDVALEERLAAYPALGMSMAELVAEYYLRPGEPGVEDPTRPRDVLEDLRAGLITRAVHGEAQLQEVLVDFWFNHFNVDASMGSAAMVTALPYVRDAIRPHVLGRFEDLLVATARSPAMLYYLDNAASSAEGSRRGRGGINENYARELLELHTLGVDGGYTEEDVVAVARAFTGWTVSVPRRTGTFAFEYRYDWHDRNPKTVLGRPLTTGGMGEGLEVLHRLASHPSTAGHVARKLVGRLVADDPPPEIVAAARATFLRTDGDLREVVRTVLTHPRFGARAHRAAKTRTPLEWTVAALRAAGAEIEHGRAAARTVGRLGQPMLAAPPPTGWPETATAVTSAGSLLGRFDAADRIARGRIPGVILDPARWRALADADPSGAPEALFASLVFRPMSRETRRALEGARAEGATPATLATIVLSSPEFQQQ